MLRFEIEKRRHGPEGPFTVRMAGQVEAGEWLCLGGPSGGGKSTVLRVIAGLDTLDKGRIEMNGEVWADTAARLHRPPQFRRAGWLDQAYALFPHMSLKRQWRYAASEGLPVDRRAPGVRVKGDAAWHGIATRLGLENLMERLPHQLSGGQQQRAALGRLMASSARLFLLDEPLSAIDPSRRRQLQVLLRDWIVTHKLPGIWVTHQGSEARALGGDMLWMENGEVIARGEADSLRCYWGED